MRSPAWDGDWPISQYFGVNPAAYVRFGLAGHNGLDVEMPEGTSVYAPAAGLVAERDYDPGGYGFYLKIHTPDGQDWLLAHFDELWEFPLGASVVTGTMLGYSGSSGNSTGPHLHIGWRLFNAPFYRGWPFNGYIDPRQVLDRLQGGLWPPPG
jgi:murein DD-endopeptidase MepM/ murein hydrolase activator NlpD